jgi:hypothetical protein
MYAELHRDVVKEGRDFVVGKDVLDGFLESRKGTHVNYKNVLTKTAPNPHVEAVQNVKLCTVT